MDAYITGLWLGDKYWWSSSIGLTNKDLSLIKTFREFFDSQGFDAARIKLSVYTKNGVCDSVLSKYLENILEIPTKNIKFYKLSKNAETNFIVYVNSRPLLREFKAIDIRNEISEHNLVKYFTGRYDADGHYWKEKRMIRIAYTTKEEAEKDAALVENFCKIKPKIRFYRNSNEWILEICGYKWLTFITQILYFSKRLPFAKGHRQLVP